MRSITYSAAMFFAFTALAHAADSVAPANPKTFSELGGVRGWRAGGDSAVYIRAQDNTWYRADLTDACMKYVTDKGVRFITEADEASNRVSKVVVDRYICEVKSLTKENPPATPSAN